MQHYMNTFSHYNINLNPRFPIGNKAILGVTQNNFLVVENNYDIQM